jgi:hypothetical protein
MKPRLCLDTAVLSALDDARMPEQQELARRFWDRLPEFDPATSEVRTGKIEDTPNPARRTLSPGSLGSLTVFPLTDEMRAMAANYIDSGILLRTKRRDALHVAATVLGRFDMIASWNLRHRVNRRRQAMINSLNIVLGARSVEIISPPEL